MTSTRNAETHHLSPSGSRSSHGDAATAGQPLVFVIDDEEGICKFVCTVLGTLDIGTEVFHTAQTAVAGLNSRTPSLIFLDVALKGSDAIDVIRALGERRYPGIVQVISGSNPGLLEDVVRVGTRHGLNMRPPLEKPFRAEAVRQVIANTFIEHKALTVVGLEEALAKGWLELWYQPKIDLRSRTLAGAEGLIRCRHPDHGVLTPANFLPQASEQSLAALAEYVVIAALRDWVDVAELGIHLHAAVNTSIAAIAGLPFAALIRENRPKSEKWPGLILEVSEQDVIKDVALAHEVATQLQIYGITFAIDDFGEGYSSFARLREMSFVELKLDRSFVKNCANDTKSAGICQAIIDLAHHFKAIAVAEGIDNASDLQAVHRMGCDLGQGFFLARPMSKTHFISTLRQRVLQQKAS